MTLPSDDRPVVITVAPTGAEVTRAHHPGLPHTPREIATAAVEAAEQGAAVVHLHVRESDGTPSGSPRLFREAIELIRAESELVTMVSTGGAVTMSVEERTGGLDARPEMAGVETGSLNFFDDVFVTSPEQIRGIVARAGAEGIALEVEAFDVGHVVSAVRMLERGELPGPLRINLVFGVPGGIDAAPEALAAMLRPLPPEAHWGVTAVGRHQRQLLALALLHGAGGVRVGFEDNVHVARGVLATSNAALVAQAARLVEALERTVATAAEARELLGLAARGRSAGTRERPG